MKESYQPLIALPSQFARTVPEWSRGTANFWQGQFPGQDPPQALSPAKAMVPLPTKVDPKSQTTAASPSPSLPSLPLETSVGTQQRIDPSPLEISPADTKTTQASMHGTEAPTDPKDPPAGDPRFLSTQDASMNFSANHRAAMQDPNAAATKPVISTARAMLSAPIQPSAGAQLADPPTIIADSSTSAFSADGNDPLPTFPPAVAIQGQILTAGAAPANIDGKPFLYDTGSIRVGSEIRPINSDGMLAPHSSASRLATAPDSSGPPLDPPPVGSPAQTSLGLPDPLQPAPKPVDSTMALAGPPGASAPNVQNSSAIPAPVHTAISENVNPGIAPDHGASPASQATAPVAPMAADGNPNVPDSRPVIVGGLTFTAVPSIAKDNYDPLPGNAEVANGVANRATPSNGPDPATYITIRSLTIAIESAINMAGTTLQPGDPGVTIHEMPISLGYSVFVVGSRTEDLAPPQKAAKTALPQQPPITISDQTINVDSNAINIDGITLKPADPGIPIDGTLVSLISSSILVVGTHTQDTAFPQNTAAAAPSYINFGGNRIRPEDNKIVVGGSTLSPGHSAVTVNGKPILLGSSLFIVAIQTTALPFTDLTAGTSHISFAVQTLTITSNELLLASTTLTPGRSPVTANGTPISLGSSVLSARHADNEHHFAYCVQ